MDSGIFILVMKNLIDSWENHKHPDWRVCWDVNHLIFISVFNLNKIHPPWLQKKSLIPAINVKRLSCFWDHLKDIKCPKGKSRLMNVANAPRHLHCHLTSRHTVEFTLVKNRIPVTNAKKVLVNLVVLKSTRGFTLDWIHFLATDVKSLLPTKVTAINTN